VRDNKPDGVIGYAAVSLPESGAWQGFWVTSALAPAGDRLLAEARKTAGDLPGAQTLEGLPGAAPADQAAIGLLGAALCRLYAQGCENANLSADDARALEVRIGAVAAALVAVARAPWLLVEGRVDRLRGGHRTTVQAIDAADADEARERIAGEIARARQTRGAADDFVEAVLGAQPRRRDA
jgi:hypothetical protein